MLQPIHKHVTLQYVFPAKAGIQATPYSSTKGTNPPVSPFRKVGIGRGHLGSCSLVSARDKFRRSDMTALIPLRPLSAQGKDKFEKGELPPHPSASLRTGLSKSEWRIASILDCSTEFRLSSVVGIRSKSQSVCCSYC